MEVTIPGMKRKPARNRVSAEAQLEKLLENYWQRIFVVVLRIVGDQYEAEDLAMETFWRYYSNPPKTHENLGGWLYRVATNLGLNAVRSRQRRQTHEQDAANWTINYLPENNPAIELEQKLERQRVRQILTEMKQRDAQILVLRHTGLTYAEIAETLQLNPNSVGKILARAEADFERRFQQKEQGE